MTKEQARIKAWDRVILEMDYVQVTQEISKRGFRIPKNRGIARTKLIRIYTEEWADEL